MRHKLLPSIFLVLVLALSSGGRAESPQAPERAPTQTPPEAQDESQQPVFRTGINFVRVDVIVTDRDGNPVTDLTADDFEVFEDGEAQTVETFQFFEFDGVPAPDAELPRPIRTSFDEEREAARSDVRLFAIFLDDYHVRLGSSLRVREPLTEFIRAQLVPTDMVAIMYPLTPLSDVRMTRNHSAIVEAIQEFRGRKYNYDPQNQFEIRYARAPTNTVEQIRNEVSLSALKALVTHLGGLREGRKALILVSEGYTNLLPPQLRNPVAAEFGDPRRRNPLFDDFDPREQSRRLMANVSIQSDLRRVYDAANRANTSIYALDPRGLPAFEFGIDDGVGFTSDRETLQSTMDTLRQLAEETDGRAILNNNDLSRGLRQVVRDSNFYYLLGYSSSDAPTDGRFHEIKVRVGRRDVQVRARKGFWALTPEDVSRIEAAAAAPTAPSNVELALSVLAARRSDRLVQTWIGTAKGEDGRTRVTFVWKPAPRVPGRRRDEPVRVSVIASGGRGSPYFRGRVPDLALVSTAPSVSRGSTSESRVEPARVTFEVDPGPLQLSLSVEGADGRVLDTDVQNFVAPDFTGAGIALSSPVVYRARNAYEMRQLVNNAQAVPETGREFRRSDRLLIRFEVYGPGASVPTVTVRLLNRGGKSMADLPFTAPATSEDPYEIDLPMASLAPGEYLVELAVSADSETAQQLIALRVTS